MAAKKMSAEVVHVEYDGPVTIVTIDRPHARNAVDRPTAELLADAFRAFDADDTSAVAILTGAGGIFCAGADLKGVGEGRGNRVTEAGDGPMGPTRMLLTKPVIAAVEGYAVAGGLELAVWCDLRVAARDAVFGVFCRRWGVPLVDGGTVRLPRLIGHSNALDLILTGRGVSGDEALRMGLVNRMTDTGGGARGRTHARARARGPAPDLHARRQAFVIRAMGRTARSGPAHRAAPRATTLASGESLEGAIRFAPGSRQARCSGGRVLESAHA